MLGRIIKYIPLQQGLRRFNRTVIFPSNDIIKYIPLQQGLRRCNGFAKTLGVTIIKYIPLQQGLRPVFHILNKSVT